MKWNYWIAFSAILFTLLGSSCSDTIDTLRETRAANEKAFLSFADSTSYTKTTLPGLGGDNYIYMKWYKHTSDTSAATPLATSSVKTNYKLYSLREYVTYGEQASLIQSNFDQENPTALALGSTIAGFSIALQNMKVGDEVGVVIPWYLAYGATDPSRLGYTSLFYIIHLKSISVE